MLFRRDLSWQQKSPLRAGVGFALGAAIAAYAFVAAPASAADAPPEVRDLFARGRDLRARGDCASAVPLFRQAYNEYRPGLGSLRNLAECEESLGHFAPARRAWLDLNQALRGNHEPKYADWLADAEQGAARIAHRVASLTVDVQVVTTQGQIAAPTDAEVTINGERLAQDQFGAVVEWDPGHYVVRAGTEGRPQEERAVDLKAGDSKLLTMRVVARPATQLAAWQASSPAETPTQKAERVSAWVAAGVGGASLVGAGVAWFMRDQAVSDLDQECPNHMCQISNDPQLGGQKLARVQSIRDRGDSATTAAAVFGVVGLAGAAVATVLFATRYSSAGGAALIVSPASVSAVGSF
ncbi:MAG: hypothetical protein M3O36_02155 [Myxococcota bacterium]|nr:hypothetical protein [Myxococcota bacterium]